MRRPRVVLAAAAVCLAACSAHAPRDPRTVPAPPPEAPLPTPPAPSPPAAPALRTSALDQLPAHVQSFYAALRAKAWDTVRSMISPTLAPDESADELAGLQEDLGSAELREWRVRDTIPFDRLAARGADAAAVVSMDTVVVPPGRKPPVTLSHRDEWVHVNGTWYFAGVHEED